MASTSPKRAVRIGPFAKGLNTFSDPSALPDDAAAEILNMELDLDGSLVSRPPFGDTGIDMSIGALGSLQLLGYYYTPAGAEYLIASDGVSSTYYLSSNTWNVLSNTFAATAMIQFDDKAWLLAPVGSANPGGAWTPSGGFVAEPNMPKGTVIISYKFRLYVAQGEQATANGSRLYFSKVLGTTPFWPAAPEFIDVARGDGQNIVAIRNYYGSLLIFRTSSIYTYAYTSDPAAGIIEVSVPGVGLDSRWSIADHENFLYFSYDDRAYEYMNGRASEIGQAIKFQATSKSGFIAPRAVSTFNNRAIFAYYDTLYVFSLITRTWSRWRMPTIGGIAKVLERRGDPLLPPAAYAMSSQAVSSSATMTNLATHGSFEIIDTSILKNGADSAGARSSAWKLTGTYSWRCAPNAALPPTPVCYDEYTISGLTAGKTYSVSIQQNIIGTFGSAPLPAPTPNPCQLTFAGVASSKAIWPGQEAVGTRRVRHSFVASGTTAKIRLHPNARALTGTNNGVYWDDLTVVEGDIANLDPFSGYTAATSQYSYAWAGAVGTSRTIRTEVIRKSRLYSMVDAVGTNAEQFDCVLRTKIFNYDVAATYKRLFWWGIDAIFRRSVVGKVIPIAYGGQVTWGEVRQRTWGELLGGTWGQPTMKGLSVETVRQELGGSAQRKFVKMLKQLRFRQVQFEVTFDTDGSSDTAPVRLFSIHSEVTGAQTVAKAIS